MADTLNILIIDDNPDDLEFYNELLSQCETEYNVYMAETAEEGLAISKAQTIDCAFIDFNLPERDGVELLEEIRAESPKHQAMVILTGEPHQKIQAEAARKGALDYIVKDAHTSPEQIEAVIQKVLNWAKELNAKEYVA